MHSTTAPSPASSPTRERLLDAAYRVCAERGLQSATTREIAEAAGVNEVTLFRHFGNKEKLLAALFARSVSAQNESFTAPEAESHDLAQDLLRYAQRLDRILFENEALIRTLLGETRRYPEQAKQVISDSVKPMKQRLTEYLQAAQNEGKVRRDVALAPAIDTFTGFLLAGMLRRTGGLKCLDYSQEEYVTTGVDLFVRGISTTTPAKSKRSRRKA